MFWPTIWQLAPPYDRKIVEEVCEYKEGGHEAKVYKGGLAALVSLKTFTCWCFYFFPPLLTVYWKVTFKMSVNSFALSTPQISTKPGNGVERGRRKCYFEKNIKYSLIIKYYQDKTPPKTSSCPTSRRRGFQTSKAPAARNAQPNWEKLSN